jgi:drug/metabolite transporter (DMT)-like permease
VSTRLGLLALILVSVGLNAAAQLFLRAAMRGGLPAGGPPLSMLLDVALRPGIVAGIACYGFSLVMWIVVLSRAEASFAYPFLGLGFVLVALASAILLGETFTARKLVGTLIIAAGVVVMAGAAGK